MFNLSILPEDFLTNDISRVFCHLEAPRISVSMRIACTLILQNIQISDPIAIH